MGQFLPQLAAADVADRSSIVAHKTGQHVFGVIENMSRFALPDGTARELFGSGVGSDLGARLPTPAQNVPLLAERSTTAIVSRPTSQVSGPGLVRRSWADK